MVIMSLTKELKFPHVEFFKRHVQYSEWSELCIPPFLMLTSLPLEKI